MDGSHAQHNFKKKKGCNEATSQTVMTLGLRCKRCEKLTAHKLSEEPRYKDQTIYKSESYKPKSISCPKQSHYC